MRAQISALFLAVAASAAWGGQVTLTGTVRDFRADGANFEGTITGLRTGAVATTLSGASPTLTASGATHISNTGAGAFDNWFSRPTDSTSYAITLNETSPGSGVYSYTNNSFFPINNQIYGNEGRSQNYHFTYAIHASFGYVAGSGQTFTFGGDDDVWVFFDGLRGIDLGGVHGFASQTVNLDTLFNAAGGRASGNYSFDFYFAERHTAGSNLTISTSLDLVSNNVPEPGSLALVLLAGLGSLAMARRRA